MPEDGLNPQEYLIKTQLIGRKLLCLKEAESTNEVAKRMIINGDAEGVLVVAEFQSAGRGRNRKKWFSPLGGLWFSTVLKPGAAGSKATLLSLMMGVALAKAITRYTGLKVRLKWPNDAIVKGLKVGGILIEAVETRRQRYMIVGIGVNVNIRREEFPLDFRDKATSLSEELKRDVDRAELLSTLLSEMEALYLPYANGTTSSGLIIEEWSRFSETLGARVRVTLDGRVVDGLAVGVDEDGALILKLEDGSIEKFISGNVSKVDP